MAIQTINIGNSANDGNGEPARSAFNKVNQNFTNNAHAASRMVGTAAGNVMEVGAFGLGGQGYRYFTSDFNSLKNALGNKSQFFRNDSDNPFITRYSSSIYVKVEDTNLIFNVNYVNGDPLIISWTDSSEPTLVRFRTDRNTVVDGNGFIKAASPIAKLFADKIELNNEASEQQIAFEKIDVGHYLVKGSSGFAQEGWYIETPKDANGNILFAVKYEQLENGDIEVRTYKKKFDLESASIVADLENPVDITLNRWIDIRLQEVPKPVPEMQTEEVNSDEPQQ